VRLFTILFCELSSGLDSLHFLTAFTKSCPVSRNTDSNS